jgi:hypothetical protein
VALNFFFDGFEEVESEKPTNLQITIHGIAELSGRQSSI